MTHATRGVLFFFYVHMPYRKAQIGVEGKSDFQNNLFQGSFGVKIAMKYILFFVLFQLIMKAAALSHEQMRKIVEYDAGLYVLSQEIAPIRMAMADESSRLYRKVHNYLGYFLRRLDPERMKDPVTRDSEIEKVFNYEKFIRRNTDNDLKYFIMNGEKPRKPKINPRQVRRASAEDYTKSFEMINTRPFVVGILDYYSPDDTEHTFYSYYTMVFKEFVPESYRDFEQFAGYGVKIVCRFQPSGRYQIAITKG